MLLECGVLISIFIVGIYVYLTWNYNYWKNADVPYLEPQIIFGNMKDVVLMKENKGVVYDNFYWQSDAPTLGVYTMRQPQLLIRDAALAKRLLANEFHCFQDNDFYVEPSDFFHSTHVFFMTGDRWKTVRNKISPALTTGKLKVYVPQMMTACRDMIDYLNENTGKEFEAKYFSGLYSVDTAMSCVYGLSCNSFKDTQSIYRKSIDNLVNPGLWRGLIITIASFCRPLGNFFKIRVTPDSFTNFYINVVGEAVNYRKANNVKRNDFLQYILDMSGKDGSRELSAKDITGYTMNVTMDMIETLAIVASLVIDMMLRHPEETKKLQEEIDKKITNIEEVTYDNMHSITYLNAFISECLRIRSPVPLLERVCTKNCEVSHEGKLYKFTKGDKVAVSLYSIHRDPKYFPDPHVFRPERFIDSDDHLGYWPFGIGPRTCLGKQFGQMEIKLFLCGILKYFDVLPARELKEPPEFEPKAFFVLLIKGGVWFKVKKRNTS